MAINLDDIKKMSPRMRALAIGVIYVIFSYFFFFYFLQTDMAKRSTQQEKLLDLEQQVATKEKLAAELGKYMKGMDALKEEFQTALTKLPVRKEIPELLQTIALSGKNAGLNFLIFEPQSSVKKPIGGPAAADPKAPDKKPPAPKPADGKAPPGKPPVEEGDYYEEIPVKVSVKGGYNNAAAFFAKVAGLPRIINIEDISMGEANPGKGKELILTTSCMVKTYMFVQKTVDSKTGAQKPAEQKNSEKDKNAKK
ncbi:MAG: type 4a pilus biogenesis protein PilO [Deltaproteobacteria bacterium]|nr:type 4a pilus biogenesis protein PilO [Deltaproteobacteria bacterium]